MESGSHSRLHNGKLVFIEEHLDRLFHGASEISLDPGRSREEIRSEINRVISANEMHDNVHLRLIVSEASSQLHTRLLG